MNTNWKTLFEVKAENLGQGDKVKVAPERKPCVLGRKQKARCCAGGSAHRVSPVVEQHVLTLSAVRLLNNGFFSNKFKLVADVATRYVCRRILSCV